jgi:hypothetical protein
VKASEEPVSTDSARACGGVPTPTSARYRRGKGMYPDGKGAAKSGTNKTAADEGTTHPSTKRFTHDERRGGAEGGHVCSRFRGRSASLHRSAL